MSKYLIIALTIILVTSFKTGAPEIGAPIKAIDCPKGLMKMAWYGQGLDEPAPIFADRLSNDFMILVDSNNFASNFVSEYESYLRRRSLDLYDFELSWIDGWYQLTSEQKRERENQQKLINKIEADSIHIVNNHNRHQVWIINNSTDTVAVQMQDASFICVLQALNDEGQWKPIQYWRFSDCGNSYYCKFFPPGIANSFIARLPNKGEFKTKLRYKLLGVNKFYYSNEFDGRINYCQFEEDPENYHREGGITTPNFKLDSLVGVVW